MATPGPMIGPGRATLGTLLQRHGYQTAAIGKWHIGMDFARLSDIDEVTSRNGGIDFDADILDGPLDHGFDEFFGTSANLRRSHSVYIRDRRFVANPEKEGQPPSGFVVLEEVLDRVTEEAVAFIERAVSDDPPFFLYLPLNAPHVPMAPNADFAGSTGLGVYADFVAQIDWDSRPGARHPGACRRPRRHVGDLHLRQRVLHARHPHSQP